MSHAAARAIDVLRAEGRRVTTARQTIIELLGGTHEHLTAEGIADLADRAPYQLSGGQKKRVAIASVLVMNPEVLLFDEPTAALDPRTQRWFLDLIVELHRAGKTIVCATHDLAALDQLADRCVVFSEDHRVAAAAPAAEILADAALLEATNLVHVHAHRHRDHVHTHRHGLDHHEIECEHR